MILADIAEPVELVQLISQAAPVETSPLNIENLADYIFLSADGTLIQIERERVSTVLHSVADIENEIRKHIREGAFIFICEGLAVPFPDGTGIFDIVGQTLIPHFYSKRRIEGLIAWLWQLWNNGILPMTTINIHHTATVISAIYHNSRSSEHKTFRRHYKHIVGWHPNPTVMSLMGIEGANIGEKRATALVDAFGSSLYSIINASPEEIENVIGRAAAAQYLRAIGR